jgi:hypothetical protein
MNAVIGSELEIIRPDTPIDRGATPILATESPISTARPAARGSLPLLPRAALYHISLSMWPNSVTAN